MLDRKCLKTSDLWSSSADCCGCGACHNVCPKGAVSMTSDAEGFAYPRIDSGLCIGCRACVRACGFQRADAPETLGDAYAAAGVGVDLSRSASAGLFAQMAFDVTSEGGAVCGSAWEASGGSLRARHEVVDSWEGAARMRGSRYVQSDMGGSMREVRLLLREGREVLFCGTPCQVAGLRAFLGKDYSNLLAVDLVCHGVPSPGLFDGYLRGLSTGRAGSPVDFSFRSKRDGWEYSLLLLLLLREGLPNGGCRDERVYVPAGKSSYYDLFLRLDTLRESCYRCPFAGRHRPGDITIGDFWGVERTRPELVSEGGPFDVRSGVSCLVANTAKGREWLAAHRRSFTLADSTFEEVAAGNDQLRCPSSRGKHRDRVRELFVSGGYPAVERWWRHLHVAHVIKGTAKRFIPRPVKRAIKRVLGRP